MGPRFVGAFAKHPGGSVATDSGATGTTVTVRLPSTILATQPTGYLRVMFAVDDLHATLDRLDKRGARLVGEVVQYQDTYLLCYIRGPGGLLIGLAEDLKDDAKDN